MKTIREDLICFEFPYHSLIISPRQTLQFAINLKVFIKFHWASYFALFLKKKLKFSKFFLQVYWFMILLWLWLWLVWKWVLFIYLFNFLAKAEFCLRAKIYLRNSELLTNLKCVIAFVGKKLLSFMAQLSLFLRL